MKRSIVWFRNDLRIHDNEALVDAINDNDEIIPLYIFDNRIFDDVTPHGFSKTGSHRLQFVVDSVTDLRKSLRSLGSELYVRVGIPEEIIPEIARECKTRYVYCNRERTQEEVSVQDALEHQLWTIGQEIRYFRGKMLYYTADLPFPITHCPDHFTSFRKEVEKFVSIRKPIDAPSTAIAALSAELESGDIYDIKVPTIDSDIDHHTITGGETEALKRLDYYLWQSDLIRTYKKTRNELLGGDYSSKFSAPLAAGCISPKLIYDEVKKYENKNGSNESTYWLIFELMWRDYFRFMAKKHGNKIFQATGIGGKLQEQSFENDVLFKKWCQGMTGIPFVDANMRELNATGYMSNRGRQNVASFLVKDMKISWILGAEYFESLLIDYDPCSNYGNWNYVAGVGTDPRSDRYFNIPVQVKKYDPNGDYIRHWIPELADAPLDFLINPFKSDFKSLNETIYPQPCIHIKNWN
ncbi:DASH family cryptochrome [Saprospiraceae bacterium]|nr:DASH family cryptochrome [Saprospiraceae bacterium]